MDTDKGSVTIPSNMLTGTDAASGDTVQLNSLVLIPQSFGRGQPRRGRQAGHIHHALYRREQTDWSNPDAPSR
jgi:hypothetical protein